MKKRTKKGFTLIELIVVIVILAVLAAVAVPVVSGWVARAKTSAVEANARTYELAVKAYMTENDLDEITTSEAAIALEAMGLEEESEYGNYTFNTDGSVEYTIN